MDWRSITATTSGTRASAWTPLAQPVFRALWLAAVASNIGTLMQTVAAAWLMTSLTTSPVPVALLTTAGSLPVFLCGLLAGALADVADRRRLVLVTQIWMLTVAGVLGVLTINGWMTTWGLLGLTFLLGIGGALSGPAWQAIMPQLVGKQELAAAVAINSAGFNLARATGPAVGGLIVAAAGPGFVFLLNGISFLGVVVVMYRWRPALVEQSGPREPVGSAVAAGVRYARHSAPLRAVLARTAVLVLAASALHALLPVVASVQLGLSATGYGVLLGSLGVGAIAGAAMLPRWREQMAIDRIMLLGTLIFAAGMVALALLENVWVINVALLAVGVTWLTLTSCLNVAAQTIAPSWVEARALGVYLLVFQGSFAAGSAGWGVVADLYGAPAALLVAATVMVLGAVSARRWPLITGEEIDLSPSQHWPTPELAWEPLPQAGPVLVTVEYQVADAQRADFVQTMLEVKILRLRDGASRWDLFRDAAAPERFLETFVVSSWAEHLRQHERVTHADRDVEERALVLVQPGTVPVVSHFIATDGTDEALPGVSNVEAMIARTR